MLRVRGGTNLLQSRRVSRFAGRVVQALKMLSRFIPKLPSETAASRMIHRLLIGSILVVGLFFIAARSVQSAELAYILECMHWTVAYAAAAAIVGLGALTRRDKERPARLWFAAG